MQKRTAIALVAVLALAVFGLGAKRSTSPQEVEMNQLLFDYVEDFVPGLEFIEQPEDLPPAREMFARGADREAIDDLIERHSQARFLMQVVAVCKLKERKLKRMARKYDMNPAVAEMDPGQACSDLGSVIRPGNSSSFTVVIQDDTEAFHYHARGCLMGYVPACNDAGVSLFYGKGVAEDRAKGARVVDLACQMGNEFSCGVYDRMHGS